MKTEWKIFGILLVIGVIVIGAFIGLSALTTQEEFPPTPLPTDPTSILVQKKEINTSDWQTYQNEEFGFEVKFPEDWRIIDDQIMPASYVERCKELQQSIDNCAALVVGGIAGETIKYFGIGSVTSHTKKIADLSREKFGNNEFYVLYNTFEGIGTNQYFIQKSGENAYFELYYTQRYDSLRGLNEKKVYQILSTFQFID